MSKLTVAATLPYRRHCPECMQEVEQTVSAAIRDNQVTSFNLRAIPKCEHQAAGPATLPGAGVVKGFNTSSAPVSMPLPLAPDGSHEGMLPRPVGPGLTEAEHAAL